MKMKLVSLFFIAVTIIMCSCQNSPLVDVVIQKNNLFEKLSVTPEPFMDTNDNDNDNIDTFHIEWSKTVDVDYEFFGSSKITFSVNADVANKVKTPISYVQPDIFDLDFAEKAVSYFCNEDYYDNVRTKSDIEKEIIYIKKILTNKDANFKYFEAKLENLNDLIEDAPSNDIPAKEEFESAEWGDYLGFKNYPSSDSVGYMGICNYGKSNTLFSYDVRYYGEKYHKTEFVYEGIPARGMNMSYEDAKNIAQNAVKFLSSNEMGFMYSKYVNIQDLEKNSALSKEEILLSSTCEQCYSFHYTRNYDSVNGASINLASRVVFGNDAEKLNYSEAWPGEEIEIVVSDKGLIYFHWFSPTKVVETINDNIKIMNFDDIFEIFKKSIVYSYIWVENKNQNIDILIDKIEYGIIRMPIKDNNTQYVTVPVWYFNGRKSIDTGDVNDNVTSKYNKRNTFIIINAIDGSIVDISLGY